VYSHEVAGIYEKAVKILETYFGAEEEDDSLAPGVDTSQHVKYDFFHSN
jgi:hypothetical protein